MGVMQNYTKNSFFSHILTVLYNFFILVVLKLTVSTQNPMINKTFL
jgi:hypothetical protein